ncbi:twin-arginine translocation signal domain-containing protein [Salmonella enterica]
MSNETGHLNRRSFLKGIVALGAVAALPGGLLTSRWRLRSRLFPLTLKRTKFIVTRVRVTAMTPVASRHG